MFGNKQLLATYLFLLFGCAKKKAKFTDILCLIAIDGANGRVFQLQGVFLPENFHSPKSL